MNPLQGRSVRAGGQVPPGMGRRDFLSKGVMAAAAAAVAGPVLAACSSSPGKTSSASSTGDDVLTIGLPIPPKGFSATQKLLASFEKSTGISVNLFSTNTASNTWVSEFWES